MSTPITNPLLNFKVGAFWAWGISQLFGVNWRVTLWNKGISYLQAYVNGGGSTEIAAVQAFLQSHVDTFVTAATGGNMFLEVIIETGFSSLLSTLVTGLTAAAVSLTPTID